MLKPTQGWEQDQGKKFESDVRPWFIAAALLFISTVAVLGWRTLGTDCPDWLMAVMGVIAMPLSLGALSIGAALRMGEQLIALLIGYFLVPLMIVYLGWMHISELVAALRHFPF
jgi:hypothetical protein